MSQDQLSTKPRASKWCIEARKILKVTSTDSSSDAGNIVMPVQQPPLPPKRPTSTPDLPSQPPKYPMPFSESLSEEARALDNARCKSVFAWAKPFDIEIARARKKWSTANPPDTIRSPADFFDGQHDKARQDLLVMIRKIPELPGFTDPQIKKQVERSVAAWKREADALGKNVGTEQYESPFDTTISTGVTFPKLNGTINSFLPPETRPLLTKNEATAISIYSEDNYAALNDLERAPQSYFVDAQGKAVVGQRIGDSIQRPGVIAGTKHKPVKIPVNAKVYDTKPNDPNTWPAGFAQVFKELENALNKTKKFDQPMKITRGLWFNNTFTVDIWFEAWRKKKLIPQNGFNSCATTGTPDDFAGQGELIMAVKQGLDLTPYSKTPSECELLLQHGTLLLVRKIDPPQKSEGPKTKYKIYVEQILVKEGAEPQWTKLDKGVEFDTLKHSRMEQPEFEKMMQWSRAKIWRDAQQEVTQGLTKLRNAYPQVDANQHKAILEAHDSKINEHFSKVLSNDLAGLLDKIDGENDDKARAILIQESKQLWNETIGLFKSGVEDKFMAALDSNPFVKLAIRNTINAARKQLKMF